MTILKKDNGTAAPADAGTQHKMAAGGDLLGTLNSTTGAGSNPVAGIDMVAHSAPTFADLDNDGDLDLVVGAAHGHLYYYENTGTGSQPDFTERTGAANPLAGIDVGDASAPTFADLDNDGDLDLVVGEWYGNLNYYENTNSRSQPGFTERTGAANPLAGIDAGDYHTPTFTDLDGDGDLDLVVGEGDGTLNYYENTGTGSQPVFTERTGVANPLAGIDVGDNSTPTFADLDNDGDLDLVVGEYDDHLYYYENTGTRSQPGFTERTGVANPLAGIDVGNRSNPKPTFADLDNDGDLDLVVGKDVGYLYYYENTGTRTEGDFNPYSSLKEDNGDAVAGVDTQYTMAVGAIFQGALNPTSNEDGSQTGDVDWVRIELTAGMIYRFGIASIAAAKDTRLHLSLLDSSGDNILSKVSSYGSDAVIDIHRVSATGTYYLKVEGGDDNTDVWDYEVSVVENTTPEGTYDEIANYLTDGFWARRAFDVEPGGTLTADITALTPAGQQLARWALEVWTSVTGIGFEFVDGDAHITFDDEEDGAHARATRRTPSDDGTYLIISSHVNISKDWLPLHATINPGITHAYVYVHEIGHALGLGHSGPYPRYADDGAILSTIYGVDNAFLNDSQQASVMSYFNQEWNTYIEASRVTPATPMIADIIAIQNLYGTPTDINLGDTVYGYHSNVDGYPGQIFSLWTGELNPFAGIDVGNLSRPTLADLDNDGDLDLVVGEYYGPLYYYEDTGSRSQPGFTERTGAADPLDGINTGRYSTSTFADLDDDGDLDLVVGDWYDTLHYYENTGSRSQLGFTERTGAADPLAGIDVGWLSVPTFADLDDDGDLDLVVGERDGILNYYENTGSRSQPDFTERTGVDNPLDGIDVDTHSNPTFADLDNDGDLDLVVGEGNGILNYFENTGSRSQPGFTKRTGVDNPLDGIDVDSNSAPTFADLDNDGDLDLVMGEEDGTLNYYENTGSRTEASFTPLQPSQSVALTLYDNGGSDTLDLRTDTADQRVDLRPEGISDVYGLVGSLVIARGTVIEHFIAGSGNDTIIGNTTANRLEGRAGNDFLWGSAGNDILIGGPGADRLVGNSGHDTASWAHSPTGVTVRLHNLSATGGDATGDTFPYKVDVRLHNLSATGGDATGDTFPYKVDVAWTDSDGVEQTESLPDVEHLSGSAHDDVLAGDRRDNVIDGGAGNDTLYGGPGGGDDRLDGGPGNDRLYGGQGRDRLTGAAGDDRLVGGPGADVFVVAPGEGQDTVTDFTDGVDRIDLTAFGLAGIDNLTTTTTTDGVALDLTDSGGGTILLADFAMASLDATDFIV